MAAQSTGIQTLLEAEKEAAKIVQKARTYRTQKLKDARTEAAKEIEELKSKSEDDFKKFEKDYEGSQSSNQTAVDKDTQEKLEKINQAFQQNNTVVIDKLLARVTETNAELHKNVQKVK